MKNDKKIRAVAEEARKILKDYPELKCYEAINRAKEVLKDERNIRECSEGNNTRTSSRSL